VFGNSDGQLLRVDLTTGRCCQEPLPAEVVHETLGGRSLGVALLENYAGIDPFNPAMPLVFTVGPLCGAPVPMATRCVLTARSPLTGTVFSCSSGGPFAWHLKRSGLTALVIQGSSASPCLLELTPAGAVVLPAKKLWGLGVFETFQRMNRNAGSAVIGLAGENGVRYASIETDNGESFSRGGLGALMGHKGLKAITVSGDVATPIADQSAFGKAVGDLMRLFRASPFLYGPFGIREQGTVALVDLLEQRGMVPGKNFSGFSGPAAQWNASALRNRYAAQQGGCYDCAVACKRLLPDGTVLPEYEGLAAFGGLYGLTDLDEITAACRVCSDLGLDPVSTGATLAVWAEITGQEVSRLPLVQLLKEISLRAAGQGELLSLGAGRLAEKLEQPKAAMTVKGLELPPFDPRASCGLALGYATSPHGANHLPAWPIASEILRKPLPTDRFSFDGKARIIAMFEDANAAVDSLVLCRFACAAAELEEMAAVLLAVTGDEYSPAELLASGRKTVARERAFNRACGFSDADDSLPDRFFAESANGLPPLDQQRFMQELGSYHRIRAVQGQ